MGVNESGRETGQSSRKGCAVRISQNASARIRRIALMVCGGVVAGVLTAGTVGAGTAFAAEKHNDAGPAGPGKGFSPNSPVDGFADHWESYHKGHPLTEEGSRAGGDPGGYASVHEEMLGHMLGN